MRGSADEESGQLGACEQMFGRCTAGELSKIANEMSLVGVAAGVRGSDPARGTCLVREDAYRTLEAGDPRELFGPQADVAQEQPFDLAAADAGLCCGAFDHVHLTCTGSRSAAR